ncbi:unnamed protein product [Sympodiomycopsis kandeliae]
MDSTSEAVMAAQQPVTMDSESTVEAQQAQSSTSTNTNPQASTSANANPQASTSTNTNLQPSTSTNTRMLTSKQLRRRLTHISPSDHLYLRLPSGVVKYVKPWSTTDPFAPGQSHQQNKKNEVRTDVNASLGKYGTFDLTNLEAVPYGWTWEIGPPKEDEASEGGEPADVVESESKSVNKKKGKHAQQQQQQNVKQQPGSLRIMVGATLAELEETTATNENIYDDPNDRSGPRLTMLDVQAMKDAGLKGQDLIEEMTRSSSSFDKRTVYSQDKFIKKKEAKHLRLFTPLAPSVSSMTDYHFERWSEKIRGLRIDSLSQMMSFGNIAPGGKYIIVDGVNGMLAAACIERMGGQGRLLAIHDNEAQPEFEFLRTMNFPPSSIDDVLQVLHWAQVDPSFKTSDLPPVPDKLNETELRKTPEGSKQFKSSERERHKLLKRHAIRRETEALRHDLFSGDWDGLLIASPYEPVSMVKQLLPYLGGSSNIVIHSPFLQPLVEAHSELRSSNEIINISLNEPWLRKYQVLPGRCHPEMQTSATGGYILHAIRVYTQEDADLLVEMNEERKRSGDGDGDGDDEDESNKKVKFDQSAEADV